MSGKEPHNLHDRGYRRLLDNIELFRELMEMRKP